MGSIDRRKRGLRAWRDLREDIGILFRSVEKRAGPRFRSPPLWSRQGPEQASRSVRRRSCAQGKLSFLDGVC